MALCSHITLTLECFLIARRGSSSPAHYFNFVKKWIALIWINVKTSNPNIKAQQLGFEVEIEAKCRQLSKEGHILTFIQNVGLLFSISGNLFTLWNSIKDILRFRIGINIAPSDPGSEVKYYQYSSWVLLPQWTQSISLQVYNQKTCRRINWNGYLLFNKNFDCDLWRSFDGRFHGIHWPVWHSTRLARSLSISAVLFGFYPPAQANF